MWMDATLDTGDMLLSDSLPIAPDDTSGTLIPKLATLGAGLLVETLDGLASGTLQRSPQDHSQATLAPAIQPEDGYIRWEESAQSLCCRIRGVSPKPGAFACTKGKKVKLWQAEPLPGGPEAQPGIVLELSKTPPGIIVATGSGAVRLIEAQPENGRRMPASDWARGLRLAPSDLFEPMISA
jgi:methionyl-tRNA formyltransferase